MKKFIIIDNNKYRLKEKMSKGEDRQSVCALVGDSGEKWLFGETCMLIKINGIH